MPLESSVVYINIFIICLPFPIVLYIYIYTLLLMKCVVPGCSEE